MINLLLGVVFLSAVIGTYKVIDVIKFKEIEKEELVCKEFLMALHKYEEMKNHEQETNDSLC